MSGRHQNTTWRAFDAEIVAQLQSARQHPEELAERLAALEPNPELSADHYEKVWERGVPEILRHHMLLMMLKAAPPRWAPLTAEAVLALDADPDDGPSSAVDDAFHDYTTRFELWSVPATYGTLLYVSPAYAARFGCEPPDLPGAAAIRDAFGGEPDPTETDLREALRDAVLDVERVRAVASSLVVPGSLPELPWTLPHGVERYEVDPAHLVSMLEVVAKFFTRAAEAGLPVQIKWHPNP